MGISIKADTSNVLKKLGVVTQTMREGLAVGIAHTIFQMARHSLQDSRSPEGVAFTPLSPRYSTIKARLFAGKPILQRQGGLLRSIFEHVEGSRAVIGATMPYAAVHQFGGVAGRRGPFKKKGGRRARIPARPFLPSIATVEKEALRVAEEIVADAIKRQGLQ